MNGVLAIGSLPGYLYALKSSSHVRERASRQNASDWSLENGVSISKLHVQSGYDDPVV